MRFDMELNKTYTLKGSLSDVYDHFANFEKFADLHPLFIKVERLNSTSFKIYEKPFNWLPITIKYRAEIELEENAVYYKAIGLPYKNITLSYTFNDNSPSIQIDYKVVIKSILPGKFILLNMMFKAQDQVVKNLQENLKPATL